VDSNSRLTTGEEYGESSFGGFGEYMRRKKLKLQNQDEEIRQEIKDEPPIFKGMVIHVSVLWNGSDDRLMGIQNLRERTCIIWSSNMAVSTSRFTSYLRY
jgi:hypothetical protein